MKVIFLDNDGVICLPNNWGGRMKKYTNYLKNHPGTPVNKCPANVRFDNFDTKSIKLLNKILEETGAEIVVSSDWRYHATLEELGDYYIEQGIIKKPFDITPRVIAVDPKLWSELSYTTGLEGERVIEIKHWLQHHPEVTHWVAVDDLNLGIYEPISGDLFNPYGLTNFVHTRLRNEGIKQSGIKEKILKHLL